MCFVFNNPSTTYIYSYCHSLSLHDALPISDVHRADVAAAVQARRRKALPGLHALPAQGGRHRGGCDLAGGRAFRPRLARATRRAARTGRRAQDAARRRAEARAGTLRQPARLESARQAPAALAVPPGRALPGRSEEHTSELQSLMRISYTVFCLAK